MTWTLETSRGFESDKIAAIAVPYLQGGRFLDIGCGMRKIWPSAIGIDNGHHFGSHSAADIPGDGTDLSVFSDGSMDAVFSSHALEHFPRERVPDILKEWLRVIKPGGHFVLYVPSANLYPKCGEPGANPDHKWDIFPGDVETMLRVIAEERLDFGLKLIESEERGETDEYSIFIVVRKVDGGWQEDVWQRNPRGAKRALVCRFGAVGDQIVAASVLPGLKAKGYHVTYLTTPEAQQVVLHDPHIDEWLIQAKDFVPNEQLGPYWDTIKRRYDLFINLSESVEGALLQLPGRLQHAYPDAVRQKLFGGVNYLERTADIAGVPHNPAAAKFHATADEMKWAREIKRGFGKRVVVWALHGSSPHKVYPFIQIVTKWLLDQTDVHIVFLADKAKVGHELQAAMCEILERNGADVSRVHPMGCGKWTIREALTFCKVADCVIGPETGPLNAVAMEAMPKVIYLSHSSHENLTRDWRNTITLLPDRKAVPCYPCHRLHYDWEHCHQDTETRAALCASSIKPEAVFEAVRIQLSERKAA